MANPNKAKGTEWESAVRDYLNDWLGLYVDGWRDFPAGMSKFLNPADPLNVKRQAQEGMHDVGDLHAWPFIVECKDVKSPAVPTWIRQAVREARNARFPFWFVCRKRRNANVRTGHVYVDVRCWTRLRLALGYGSARHFYEQGRWKLHARGMDTGKWYFETTLHEFAPIVSLLRAVDISD